MEQNSAGLEASTAMKDFVTHGIALIKRYCINWLNDITPS